MRRLTWALVGAALLGSTGCLEHEETLTVHPDGSLEVSYVIHGDGEDLDQGAAAQPGGAPWAVERTTRAKQDGKLEHVLRARAEFARAAELPACFGDPESALTRSTELTVTPSAEGRVFRFSRAYGAREWAPYAFAERRAFPDEVKALVKQLGEFASFTDEERGLLVRALCAYEQAKVERWAEAALAVVAPGADPGRAALEVQEAIRGEITATVDPAFLARLLADPQEIKEAAKGLEARVHRAAAAAAARALELGPQREQALREELARQRRVFEVSEDLGDEAFVVRLRLPGVVLRHNADEVQGDTLIWRFTGQDLRDRTHRLLATSLDAAK
ncbi:MAG: hypothetical protein KDD82_16745 [Planctomycetes bacterium]|nr:hypothetical protein [Planctomycetota bacterium]